MSRAIARNPEVVVVQNPAIPFPLFEEKAMKGRKRRRKDNNKRKVHRRRHIRRGAYSKRRARRAHRARRGAYRRRRVHAKRRACRIGYKCKKRRRPGAYAKFAKSMWHKHRAAYKRMGFKKASRAIGAAWRAKH